jgi:hypothetical protein
MCVFLDGSSEESYFILFYPLLKFSNLLYRFVVNTLLFFLFFFFSTSFTSTSYDAPSILTTMHRREQTIFLQLINNKKEKKVTYLQQIDIANY